MGILVLILKRPPFFFCCWISNRARAACLQALFLPINILIPTYIFNKQNLPSTTSKVWTPELKQWLALDEVKEQHSQQIAKIVHSHHQYPSQSMRELAGSHPPLQRLLCDFASCYSKLGLLLHHRGWTQVWDLLSYLAAPAAEHTDL